jgi:pilus assembly protein CpaF
MEPTDREIDELVRLVSAKAGTVVAEAFAGRDLRTLSEVELGKAEAVLLSFCEREDRARSVGSRALGVAGQKMLAEHLFDEIFGLGFAERYTDGREPDVEEVSIDGPHKGVIRRAGNHIEFIDPGFRDPDELRAYVQRVMERGGRRVDDSSPYQTVRLANGCRAAGVVSISSSPRLTIRIPLRYKPTLPGMVELGTVDERVAHMCDRAVVARLNIAVVGGTGSGKTTFLQALCGSIPEHERIVTIEEDPELQLEGRIVRQCIDLWERPPNLEGVGAVGMRELVRFALRMRPDRILIGEVRGSEAIDMIAAMNSGHSGSLCSLHADDARSALTKLEHYIRHGDGHWTPQAAKEAVASTLDLVIYMRQEASGRRVVQEIIEVAGCENGEVINSNSIVTRRNGIFEWSGIRMRKAAQLEAAGWRG